MLAAYLILILGGFVLADALRTTAERRAELRRGITGVTLFACACAFAVYVFFTEDAPTPPFYQRVQSGLVGVTIAAIVGCRFATKHPRWERMLGWTAFILAVLTGSHLLHEAMLLIGTAVRIPPKALSMALQTIACAGVAVIGGIAVVLALSPGDVGESRARVVRAIAARWVLSVALVFILHQWWPLPPKSGGDMMFRWGVGLFLPGVLVVFSARGRWAGALTWLAGVLLLVGEWTALDLTRRTGLPF